MASKGEAAVWAGTVRRALQAVTTRLRDELSSAPYRPDDASSPRAWVGEARDALENALRDLEADTWSTYCLALKDRLARRRAAWRSSDIADPDGYGASALGAFMAELDRLGSLSFDEASAPPGMPNDAVPGPDAQEERATLQVGAPCPLPRQWRSGPALLLRWLVACGIDYAILIGAVLLFAFIWPGGSAPLEALGLILLVQALFQPLGEGVFQGTPGQYLAGIRLVAPGTGETPSARIILLRHGYRIGMLWGVAHALAHWLAVARATPEGRCFLARDRDSAFDWIFIDR